MTPLVDVVFNLLLFFMLTAHYVETKGIKVQLPQSITSENTEKGGAIIVVDEKGEVHLNQEKVKVEKLHELLMARPLSKRTSLQIWVDRNVKVSLLTRVIDEVRLSGFHDFAIVTAKEPRHPRAKPDKIPHPRKRPSPE